MTAPGLLLCLAALLALTACGSDETAPRTTRTPAAGTPLTDDQVTRFARVALAGITREYPNKPGNVVSGPEDVLSPRAMHPAFYGCFDWHSAVHGHWTLVRLLKLHPAWIAERDAVITAVGTNLSAENLRVETDYFDAPENRSFERTYGWAWLLRLAQELRTWDHDLGRTWATNLRPLEDRIVELAKAYLPKLTVPVRSGEHRDTAFGLAFMLDYARAVATKSLSGCAAHVRTPTTRTTVTTPSPTSLPGTTSSRPDSTRRISCAASWRPRATVPGSIGSCRASPAATSVPWRSRQPSAT